MPPNELLPKGEWIDEFASELTVHIRPELGAKHAHKVATYEWAARKAIAPAVAAKQWATEQEARRKKP
jgi:hypothetical protein